MIQQRNTNHTPPHTAYSNRDTTVRLASIFSTIMHHVVWMSLGGRPLPPPTAPPVAETTYRGAGLNERAPFATTLGSCSGQASAEQPSRHAVDALSPGATTRSAHPTSISPVSAVNAADKRPPPPSSSSRRRVHLMRQRHLMKYPFRAPPARSVCRRQTCPQGVSGVGQAENCPRPAAVAARTTSASAVSNGSKCSTASHN
eukprot:SAG31_NODE_9247_length_1308_cov_2.200165_2_plen_201_part_00